ncbi:ABC transporter permease [Pseudonocardia endophytica]|uniref:ABC-2 type transport system permease protein n=1 Tax=Pseudonocardia endophytica TaxID=401976 RepID=A0A4R1I9I6_PSEEN|nr:ABC transporter permease [Pseudonocardia endophytica]TCK26922.1 ABC-2 type transport system permease protein [Pseudonocardia endophytica]
MSAPLGAGAAIALIARREISTTLRSRTFLIGLVITVVILVGYAVLFAFIGSQFSSSSIALSGQAQQLRPVLASAAERAGTDLTLTDAPGPADQTLRGDDAPDAVLEGGPGGYRLIGLDDVDGDLQNLVSNALRQNATDTALRAAGADPAAIDRTAAVQVSSVNPEDPLRGQRIGVAFAVAFLLFISVQTYGSLVAQGVVEEKSSRVVELLLSTIRPVHLLAGKILGLGLVGLLQLVILGAIGIVGGLAVGALTVPTAALSAIGTGLLWYLVGFFLYASAFGALGATVSRQEELQSAITPLIFPLLIPFVLSVSVLPNDPRNPLITVLSFIPFLSQSLMPARAAIGVASGWEQLIAFVLAVIAIAVVVRLAARIYQNSVLRTGAKVSWSEALRGSPTARP